MGTELTSGVLKGGQGGLCRNTINGAHRNRKCEKGGAGRSTAKGMSSSMSSGVVGRRKDGGPRGKRESPGFEPKKTTLKKKKKHRLKKLMIKASSGPSVEVPAHGNCRLMGTAAWVKGGGQKGGGPN